MSAPNLTRLRPARLGGLVAVCAIVALLVAMAAPSRADAARVQYAGTFRVLHPDHVGRLDCLSPTVSFRRSTGAGFPTKPLG